MFQKDTGSHGHGKLAYVTARPSDRRLWTAMRAEGSTPGLKHGRDKALYFLGKAGVPDGI